MELNWSTFVLELVNFLVLLWILKHFLYRPVLAVIAERRRRVEKTLAEAAEMRSEAERLKTQYEGRLEAWDKERARAREALEQELEKDRASGLAALKAELEQQHEKARSRERQRLEDAARGMEETALAQGAEFAMRLLEHSAGPELEARLIELAIDDIGHLSAKRAESMMGRPPAASEAVVVYSAFPLPASRQEAVEKAVRTLTGPDVSVRFEQDPALLAGLRIAIGAWMLGLNLRDELQGFVDLAHGD
jgi:F-type H+-transporting ATPase subunit b